MVLALSELVSWLSEEHDPELAENIVNWIIAHPEYKATFEYYAQSFEPSYAIYLIIETIKQVVNFVNIGYY